MAKNDSPTAYQPMSCGIRGFLERLFVGTPAYKGNGQPPASAGGLLRGLLGGLFGGTPAYRAPKPMPAPDAPVNGVAQHAPAEAPACECAPDPSTDPMLGPEPSCQSPVTIVIARD